MKNKTLPVTGKASDDNAGPVAIKLNTSAVAGGVTFSIEQLRRLGEIYLGLQMAGTFGGMEQPEATAVMAGIVTTLHTVLPPEQFRGVMILWEVDAIKLSEYLHLAQVSSDEREGGEGKDFISI